MMPDAYDILMGNPMSSPEDMEKVAKSLRGQQNLGSLLGMTGYSRAQPVADNLTGGALKQAAGIAAMREAERDRKLDQDRWNAEMGLKKQELSQKQEDWEKMPYAQTKDLMDAADLTYSTGLLSKEFKPEYAGGIPGMRPLANTMASLGVGTDNSKEAQMWWSEWDRLYTLPERNEKFGATLSEGEKQAWRQANINPNMTAKQIQEGIAKLNWALQNRLNRMASTAEQMGGNPRQIYAAVAPPTDRPGMAEQGPSQATSQYQAIDVDDEGKRYGLKPGADPTKPESWVEL